jgi:hypothetical protein
VRYLPIGNGPDKEIEAKISSANIFVQINSCEHAGLVPKGKRSYIFVTNAGGHSAGIMSKIGHGNHVVIFARNPLFYSIKKYVLRILGSKSWQYFSVDRTPSGFCHINVIKSCRLELKFLRQGMKLSYMPSTGAIAYHWTVMALQPGDSLDIAGFAFEGWYRHPWELEMQLIKTIEWKNWDRSRIQQRFRSFGEQCSGFLFPARR